MAKMERSIVVNAPLDKVDAYTMDARRLPEWYPGIESAEPTADYPQVGSSMKVVYKAAGVTFNMTFTVNEYVKGQAIGWDIEGMMTGRSRYTLAHEGGGTKVTGLFDYEVPGGGLGKVLDKLVIERMNTQNLENSLDNLKRIMES